MFRYVILAGVVLTLFASTQAQASNTQSTVYVYMTETRSGFRRFTGTFFMDDKRTAEISENRYFVLHPSPGKHSFYVKDKKFGGVVLDVAEGATYYIKLTATFEAGSTRFREVALVPKEEGEFSISQYKAIKKSDIYDFELVDVKFSSPK